MKHILVVDDKEENRYYLQALLGAHGYRVSIARHGAEALVLARQSPPLLVISDLLMPVMDGYTLLRHWKSDPQLKDLPFIVYTATYTETEDERLAIALGADTFILKPAEPDVFLQRMHEVMTQPARRGVEQQADENAEAEVLRHYSETLIRKLEEKSLQLTLANAQLEQDIERRKNAEAALRESEERFRLLTMATSDAVWDWDICADKVWWSDGFRQLFGHALADENSTTEYWKTLIHEQDRARVLDAMEAALREGHNLKVSYRLQRADGTWALVEDKGLLLRDSAGNAVRMVGGMTDVSERAALEARLRNSQRLEAVGQLTGGIAHDFNNLLTVVLGNAETLVELLEADPKKRELARMIVGAAERGAELTQRLLAFARRQSLIPHAVDVNTLLSGLAMMLDRVLGASIRFHIEAEKPLLPALVDAAQLEHAILNLCVNARDAMPSGGTLKISTKAVCLDQGLQSEGQTLTPGHYVQIQIVDTGVGISAEHLSKVFEPFFTTKSEGKGSGLGLAMVYGFVRQSGGSIQVASEPGKGSCFTLYLPVSEQPADEQEHPLSASANVAEHLTNTRCILFVEDDVLVRQITQHNLGTLGFRVVAAGSGDAALALAKAMTQRGEQIDLLFTDVQMAGMSGPELVLEMQRLVPDIRVLYASGYSAQLAEPGRLPGTTAPVLAKPYRRAELATAIAAVLP